MAIRISNEEMDLFAKNGISQEALGRSIDGFRANGLSDNDIQLKIQNKLSSFNQGIAQPKVSTQLGTNISSPNHPQVVQEPVEQTSNGFWGGVKDVVSHPGETLKQVWDSFVIQPKNELMNPVFDTMKLMQGTKYNQLEQDLINRGMSKEDAFKQVSQMAVGDAKNILQRNPLMSLGAGAVKGTVELPQDVQNIVADIKGSDKKWDYTKKISDAIANNKVVGEAYQDYVLKPMDNNKALTTLGEFIGAGFGVSAPVKNGVKAMKLAKLEKAIKADQIAKYNAYMPKTIKAKAKEQLALEAMKKAKLAKANPWASYAKALPENLALGAGLGLLEGENWEERKYNAGAGTVFGTAIPAIAPVAKSTVKGVGKVAKPINTKYNQWLDGSLADNSIIASNSAGDIRKFEVKTSKSGKQTLESIAVDENGNVVGKQPNIQNLDALKAKYKTDNIEDIIKYEHSNQGFYDAKTDTMDVSKTDTTFLPKANNETPGWWRNKLANIHASLNNAWGIQSSPSKLVQKYMNVDKAVARRNLPSEMKFNNEQKNIIKEGKNYDDMESKVIQLSAQTGIPEQVIYDKIMDGTWKGADAYLKEQRLANRKANVERIQQQNKKSEPKAEVIENDSDTFFEDLLEQERKEAEGKPAQPKNESLSSEDINTPVLEGKAVKTSEDIPTDDYYAENIPEENLGREITKEEFEALKAQKQPKSYKQKVEDRWNKAREEGRIQPSEESQLHKDIKGEIEAKRRAKGKTFEIQREGEDFYFKGEDGTTKVYGKGKKPAYVAEGARDLSKRTVGEENIYERYDELFEKPEEGVSKRYLREGIHETSVDQPAYQYAKNESPEFMKWYDEYSKADSKTKNKMLSEKLKSYKTQDEASAFYEKFSEYEMKGNERKRAGKVGDETYDTADVSETERLTKAIEEEDIQYEKAEPAIDVHSSGFRKLLEASWDKMPRGKAKNAKTYIKGKLQAWRESADFQKEYDKIVKQLSGKGFSPKIQEAMLSDINAIADSVIESKKQFGVTYKKTRNLTQNIYNQLVEANKTGQLAKGKQIIDSNNLKHKYVDENMKNALKDHYIDSVEKANAKLNAMGVEKNAQGEYVFNQEKAIEWAKNESKSKYKNNHRKLVKDLELLEKRPDVALERAKNAINKVISANKNIIANDTRFAFEAPQKKLKEISAKGDQQRWKVEETGDTWDRKSSDVDAGERLANKASTSLENIYNRDLGKEYVENRAKSMSKVIEDLDKMTTKEIIDAWDKYGKDLDQHYMNNSGKDVVPNSELPSAKYFEAKKRVDTIKNFDESVKANSELKAGKISNKDYAEFGADENLKQYAKDYPDKEIIIETYNDPSVGGAFSIKTENMHFYTSYTGKTPMAHIRKHEFRHSQQWKDPSKRELFKEASKLTEEADKMKTAIKETVKKVISLHSQGKLKLLEKKDGTLSKRTVDKLNTLLGDDAKAFIEWYNKDAQRKGHPIEVDAENFAKGVNDDTIWSRNTRDNGSKSFVESNEGASGTRGNSKGKMDEANAEAKSIQEEGKVKFSSDEFNKEHLPKTSEDKTKAQAEVEAKAKERQQALDKCKNALEVNKVISKDTERIYLERGMLDPEQATRAMYKRGARKQDAFYLPKGNKEIESNSFFDPAEDGTWAKENWTGGTKKRDGLNTDNHFSTVQKANIARNLYANDVNSAVNLIRNELAIPFKANGEIPKGYMAVNENLLYKVAHARGGIEMYNTMLDRGAKFKQFFGNDKKLYEAWDKLLEKDRVPDYLLPQEAVMKLLDGSGETPKQYFARYFGQGKDWRFFTKVYGAIEDASLARLKMGMLGTCKFISNNLRTNTKMSILAGGIKDFVRGVLDAKYIRDEDIPSGVVEDAFFEAERRSRHKKLETGIQAIDNFFNLINGHELDSTPYKRLVEGKDIKTNKKTSMYVDTNASRAIEGLNKLNWLNKKTIDIADGLFRLNSKIERTFRKIEFAKALNKQTKDRVKHTANRMYTIREMVKEVKNNPELESVIISQIEDVYGNYNSFNQFERGVMKRIFPFYAWDRVLVRNTRFMFEKHPEKWAIAKLMMLRREIKNDDENKHPILSTLLMAKDGRKPLVDYQRKANRTELYNKASGGYLINNNTSADAYMDEIVGKPGKILDRIYGKVNPRIKGVINAVKGTKDHNMGFETGRYKYQFNGKYKDNKTGKEVDLPLSERAKYLAQNEIGSLISPYSKNSVPGLVVAHARAIPHAIKTGEWRLPDKSKDVGFGGLYVGEKDKYGNKVYGKNNVDYKYQMMNAVSTSYTNPREQRKAQKEKWQKQSRKLRGN